MAQRQLTGAEFVIIAGQVAVASSHFLIGRRRESTVIASVDQGFAPAADVETAPSFLWLAAIQGVEV